MANFTEITPVLRRVVCDRRGRAQLVFTLSNVLSRPVEVAVKILAAAPLDAGWFTPQGGEILALAPRASGQLVIEARLAPLLPPGEYSVRVEVVEANRSEGRRDTSPGVLVQVSQPILGLQPAAPGHEIATDTAGAKPGRRRLKPPVGGFSAFLRGLLRRLFTPFLNWFWSGQPAGARVVDLGIVKKALVLMVMLYVVGLGPRLLSAGDPSLTEAEVTRHLESSSFARLVKVFIPKGAEPTTKASASLCDWFR
ncbi:hypothetical protein THIOKS1620004 [Thiocapsa sp. KS1]|nr:hypothetical protein [Thiocapsa sp. KS1]CRI67473.1 hypothetical protein THIOKS1620004 [Thiocapsa sp. KS1]